MGMGVALPVLLGVGAAGSAAAAIEAQQTMKRRAKRAMGLMQRSLTSSVSSKPELADFSIYAALEQERIRKLLGRRGIKTSAKGLEEEPYIGRKTLLGE